MPPVATATNLPHYFKYYNKDNAPSKKSTYSSKYYQYVWNHSSNISEAVSDKLNVFLV